MRNLSLSWEYLFKDPKVTAAPPDLCTLLVLTVAPLLTKWQMGYRGFYDLNKQAKVVGYALKSRPQSVFSSSMVVQYFWRTHCQERKVCQKGDRSAWCLARTKWKHNKWKLCSPPPPWHYKLSPSLSGFLSFFFVLASFVIFHPDFHPHLLLFSFCHHSSHSPAYPCSFSASPSPSGLVYVTIFSFPTLPHSSSLQCLSPCLSPCLSGHGPISPIGLVAV